MKAESRVTSLVSTSKLSKNQHTQVWRTKHYYHRVRLIALNILAIFLFRSLILPRLPTSTTAPSRSTTHTTPAHSSSRSTKSSSTHSPASHTSPRPSESSPTHSPASHTSPRPSESSPTHSPASHTSPRPSESSPTHTAASHTSPRPSESSPTHTPASHTSPRPSESSPTHTAASHTSPRPSKSSTTHTATMVPSVSTPTAHHRSSAHAAPSHAASAHTHTSTAVAAWGPSTSDPESENVTGTICQQEAGPGGMSRLSTLMPPSKEQSRPLEPFSALPAEILSLIFTFYISSTIPGSKAFTDLLCLSRAIHDQNVNRAYEKIILTRENVLAFFRPWREWFEKAQTELRSQTKVERSVTVFDIYVRTWLAREADSDRRRSVTIVDAYALLEVARFLHNYYWSPVKQARVRARGRDYKPSPQYFFRHLHHLAFPASIFDATPVSRIAWETYGSSFFVNARHSPQPETLTVLNCFSPYDIPLVGGITSSLQVEIFLRSPRDTGLDQMSVEDIEQSQEKGLCEYFEDVSKKKGTHAIFIATRAD
ncbi:hypothetical protein I350_05703 [Cryptococcus amylolentus CBS 6273]|uniref:Uncharacterized protein n=1 Tax=Cryptococcus amylolentus CBS 6273 TaxID=1296118 RepID=A0A1E3JSI0_9TREE|nr:hypothetical protein I350_05703 [Cryptococcus amylolentus CBS 6273]